MAKRNAEELGRLKAFCSLVANCMFDSNDAAFHAKLVRVIDGVTSVSGMRQVVADLLEWSQDLGGARLAELDARLSAKTLPTLALMRARADRQLVAIFVRGCISDEDEYRLVVARSADMASDLSEADRALAGRLLAAFEAKRPAR